MQITTEISFNFNTPEDAKIFYSSFMPEFHDMPQKRSIWHVSPLIKESSEIKFKIQSEDATAFRATINSLIQFAHVVEKTLNLTLIL